MRDINECRAEVFCRAENKIKNLKRRRRRVVAVCIPLCLIVGVLSVLAFPRMLPTDNGGVVTTEDGNRNGAFTNGNIPDCSGVSDSITDGLENEGLTEVKPISYSFSLIWSTYGTSSYDSLTGRLVKDADATDPDEYTTILCIDDEKMLEIQKIIDDLDIESYHDSYDPFGDGGISNSPTTLILTVKTENFEKTVSVVGVTDSYTSGDPKGQKFLDACHKIIDIITATDEWKSLPEYERLYE